MDTYLMITDITGKQYPCNITHSPVNIDDFKVSENDYQLDKIRNALENQNTIRIANRIFKTEKLIEISIIQYPKGE